MKFDDITEDGRLWAVRYDDNAENAFYQILDRWNDVLYANYKKDEYGKCN